MAALAGARAGLALVRRACGGGVTHGFGLLLRRQLSSLPPHTLLPMPALSPTMTTGNLAAWKKKAGDAIAAGDVIAEVETDKATVDYEVVDEGILAKILVPEGTQDVEVGTPVAVLVEDASHVDAFKDYVAKPDAPAPAPASESKAPAPSSEALAPASAAPAPAPAPAPASGSPAKKVGGVVSASPLARQLAASMGVSLSEVKGTGPGGRIIAADVSEAADAQKSAPPAAEEPAGSAAPAPSAPKPSKPGQSYVDIPHSNIRKVTAKNMVQNKNSNPHYYVTMEIGMDELIAMRKKANELLGAKISVNDYIIKAAALSLKEVPMCNSSWTDEYIRQYSSADVSVAVNTEKGLLTPIVFGADSKSVAQISSEIKELAGKAKENKLKPEQFLGGTFTISNLGSMGVKQFTAIINSPQACILAVGGTDIKVIPTEGGGFGAKSVMLVSLSSDHRVVDGMLAAQFLQSFKRHMENPLLLLL